MMNRSAAFEITRFGENAPSTSCRKLTRPPTADALTAILPAAGFMVVTEGFLFLARQNDFYAPVLCSAFGCSVRCKWLGVAIGMNAETAVGEVRGSFSLEPITHGLGAPLCQVHVPFSSAGIVGVPVQGDKQSTGNRQVVFDLIHLAFTVRREGSLAGVEFDAPVTPRNDGASVPA